MKKLPALLIALLLLVAACGDDDGETIDAGSDDVTTTSGGGPVTTPPPPTSAPGPTEAPTTVAPSPLDAARARWAASGSGDYELIQSVNCFCAEEARGPFLVTVVDGAVTDVGPAPDSTITPMDGVQVRSVEDLFAEIEAAMGADVARIDVTYDGETGVPTEVYIDEDETIADEEIGWTTTLAP
jgi:Family of unknown function (DUF6174)